MDSESWRSVLVAGLGLNAAVGFGYRIYRLSKGGPIADVWGQAVLGVVLAGLAVGVGFGLDWTRWPALGYAIMFAVVAMPVWVLAVLIPMPPRAADYAFTALYWATLIAIGVAAIAL